MFYLIIITFFISLFLFRIYTNKPLYNDDGSFLYYATFANKGYKPFNVKVFNKSCPVSTMGGIEHIFRFFSWVFNNTSPSFFQHLQVIWLALLNTSLTYYIYLITKDILSSLLAMILMSVIILSKENLFYILLGETYSLLQFVWVNILFYKYIQTGNYCFLTIAGFFMGWMLLIKITNLPIVIYYILISLFLDVKFGILYYFAGIISIFILANLFILITNSWVSMIYYNKVFWSPLAVLFNHYFYPKNKRYEGSYIDTMKSNKTNSISKMKLKNNKKFWEQFSGYFLLAAASLIYHFFSPDLLVFLHFVNFLIFIAILKIQNFYYITKYNAMLFPLVIIIAIMFKKLTIGLPLINSLFIFVFILIVIRENIFNAISHFKEENLSKIHGFKYFDSVLQISKKIGLKIKELSNNSDEKLVVWGNLPNINIYAKLPFVFFSMNFIYPGRKKQNEEKIQRYLNYCRFEVPKWYVEANYFMKDKWTIKDFSESTGIPYKLIENYNIKNFNGIIRHGFSGKKYEFPLYERDDSLYEQIIIYHIISNDDSEFKLVCNAYENQVKLLSNAFKKKITTPEYEKLSKMDLLDYYRDKVDKIRGDKSKFNMIFEIAKLPNSKKNEEIDKLVQTANKNYKSILFYWKAFLLKESGYFEDSLKIYENSIELEKNNFFPYLGLGDIYFNYGYYDKAIEFYNQVLEINNLSAEAFNNLGVVFIYLKKYRDAKFLLEKAIKLKVNYKEAKSNLSYFINK